MPRVKGWPADVYPLYQQVLRHYAIILDAATGAREGITDRNKRLVGSMLGLIEHNTVISEELCRQIAQQHPDRPSGGRPLKWFEIILNINASLMTISDLLPELKEALEINEFIYLAGVFGVVEMSLKRIQQDINEAPAYAEAKEDKGNILPFRRKASGE